MRSKRCLSCDNNINQNNLIVRVSKCCQEMQLTYRHPVKGCQSLLSENVTKRRRELLQKYLKQKNKKMVSENLFSKERIKYYMELEFDSLRTSIALYDNRESFTRLMTTYSVRNSISSFDYRQQL